MSTLFAYFQCIFGSVRLADTLDDFAVDSEAQHVVRDFVIVGDGCRFGLERNEILLLLLIIIHFVHFLLGLVDDSRNFRGHCIVDTQRLHALTSSDRSHNNNRTVRKHKTQAKRVESKERIRLRLSQ